MPQQKNTNLIKALLRQPTDRTPIWLMRQAGRYLPEYRATREKAGSFMQLCKTPDLACEVTLQPLRRYDLDAAIIFSDILTIPDAMGLGLEFREGSGPFFQKPLQTEADIQQLKVPDMENLRYVYDAIKLVKKELSERVPLIGFCGSPWTIGAYMIAGESKTRFSGIFNMLQEQPLLLHNLLDILAQSVATHLNCQIEAGADVVMLFDTWGGMLDTPGYEEFSLYYLSQVLASLTRNYNNNKIPVILFTKGGNQWLEKIAKTGCDGIGLDWEIGLNEARQRVGSKVALQGNLNPALLLESPEIIQQEVARVLASYGHGEGHVFNLGHGISPNVPPENVKTLVDTVHNLSKSYHG